MNTHYSIELYKFGVALALCLSFVLSIALVFLVFSAHRFVVDPTQLASAASPLASLSRRAFPSRVLVGDNRVKSRLIFGENQP